MMPVARFLPLVFLLITILGLIASQGLAKPRNDMRHGMNRQEEAVKRELREGDTIDNKVGRFRFSGDRMTFIPNEDEREQMIALENLALERIARVLEESSGEREWNVTGVVSEYRGATFLRVTRAILKTKPGSGK